MLFANLVDDVQLYIVQQLDPFHLADRYVLYNCLLASTRFFKAAAEQLWSTKILSTVYNSRWDHDKCWAELLLKHVAATEPHPQGKTLAFTARGTREWRLAIYLRGIRRLDIVESSFDKRTTLAVNSDRLLPWLPKLDSLGVLDGSCWSPALARRFSTANGGLRHLSIFSNWRAADLTLLVERGLRSLTVTSNLARHVYDAVIGGRGRLQYLRFTYGGGTADLEAVANCLIAQGVTLRTLHLDDHNILDCDLNVMMAQVLPSVSHLTDVKVQLNPHSDMPAPGSVSVVRGLLHTNNATLDTVNVSVRKIEVLNLLPFAELSKLQSLVLDINSRLDDLNPVPWLTSLPFLRRLVVKAREAEYNSVVALLNVVNKISWLQELAVTVLEDVPTTDPIEELQLRMGHLRSLFISWELQQPVRQAPAARLNIVDWDDIKKHGLPLLEELELDVVGYEPGFPAVGRWEFPGNLDLILDAKKTPALVSAKINVTVGPIWYRYKLTGGRNNFNQKVLKEMRERVSNRGQR